MRLVGRTPAEAVQTTTSNSPSSSQPRRHTAFWVEKYSNGLEFQLQDIVHSEKLTVFVDSRVPVFLLIDNDTALTVFTLFFAVSFCWFALKGFLALL